MSPVIATVILVAVAITVAVAYWLGGIAGQYTQFERCEVQTVIVMLDSYGNWVVSIKLKNSGSKSATLSNIFVNDARSYEKRLRSSEARMVSVSVPQTA